MEEQTDTPGTGDAEAAVDDEGERGTSIGRLANYGQETVKKAAGDLGSAAAGSQPVTAAKDKFDQATHSLMAQLHVASTEQLDDLRSQIADLEERLSALEGKKRPAAARDAKDVTADG